MNTVIQISGTIPLSYFYYKLNNELQTFQAKKIASNSTSFFHASFTICLGLIHFYTNKYAYLMQINTGGYFLFDLYYLINDGKYDLLRFMYFYHHIVLYPYILIPYNYHYWPQIIFFGELSNIPNYLVYYSLKNDEKKNLWKGYKSKITKFLLRVQLYFYGFIRILILGYYSYLEYHNPKLPKFVLSVLMLYPFGLVWFFAMLKQYIYLKKY